MRRWLAVAGLVGVLLAASGGVAGAARRVIGPVSASTTVRIPEDHGGQVALVMFGTTRIQPVASARVRVPSTFLCLQMAVTATGGHTGSARSLLARVERHAVVRLATTPGGAYTPLRATGTPDVLGGHCGAKRGRWWSTTPGGGGQWVGQLALEFAVPTTGTPTMVVMAPFGRRVGPLVAWG